VKKKSGNYGSEKALAAQLKRERGRTEHWSKKPVKVAVKKPVGAMFSMRLSAAELGELRRRASQQGLGISEYIRKRALSDEPTAVNLVSNTASFYASGTNFSVANNLSPRVVTGRAVPDSTNQSTFRIPFYNEYQNFYFYCAKSQLGEEVKAA
jgi:hypothetical protein